MESKHSSVTLLEELVDIVPLIQNSSNIYIKLSEPEMLAFSVIKDLWKSMKQPVNNTQIFSFLRKSGLDTKKIKKALVDLHNKRKIVHSGNGINWMPAFTEEEAELEKKLSNESNVSDEKIFFIIRKFFADHGRYPKPSEIEDEFLHQFGKPSIADFGRHLRKMAEEGKLMRNDDFEYYLKSMTVGNKLSRWMW